MLKTRLIVTVVTVEVGCFAFIFIFFTIMYTLWDHSVLLSELIDDADSMFCIYHFFVLVFRGSCAL